MWYQIHVGKYPGYVMHTPGMKSSTDVISES